MFPVIFTCFVDGHKYGHCQKLTATTFSRKARISTAYIQYKENGTTMMSIPAKLMKDKDKKMDMSTASSCQEETELDYLIVSSSSFKTMETPSSADDKTEPVLLTSSSPVPLHTHAT